MVGSVSNCGDTTPKTTIFNDIFGCQEKVEERKILRLIDLDWKSAYIQIKIINEVNIFDKSKMLIFAYI
jgi:hypothetical protein